MLFDPSLDEDRSTAINVFINDAGSLYQEASVPNILPSPFLYEDQHTSPNPYADEISISEIMSNWAREYVKSLGIADE